MEPPRGLISGIERFALHDGPGIRTLVFMKGCPLRCLWCSSPHTQHTSPELLYDESKCHRCGSCTTACPAEALLLSEMEGLKVDRRRCISCGECVQVCPDDALRLAGMYMTVEQLYGEIKKDSSFYRRSDGGVTIGGGEPTMQPDFLAGFLERCKQQYIHTAMETCGYVIWQHLERLAEHLDLVYADIKHMDARTHRDLTGVPNELILDNIKKLSAVRPLIIRIPIVPGYNDSDGNVRRTAEFAVELGENCRRIELLPYHQFGVDTYALLGRQYKLTELEPPINGQMQRLKETIESCGIAAWIGG